MVGDGLNTCSRVESLNKEPGTTILVTQTTWDALKEEFVGRADAGPGTAGKEEEPCTLRGDQRDGGLRAIRADLSRKGRRRRSRLQDRVTCLDAMRLAPEKSFIACAVAQKAFRVAIRHSTRSTIP